MKARKPRTIREAVIASVKAGEVTIVEAAAYLMVSRVTMWRWVKATGIDPDAARVGWVAAHFRKLTGQRQPSKAELREEAIEAKQSWDWRNGHDRPADVAQDREAQREPAA